MTHFQRGDLVRVTDRKHPHVVKFARVWRVEQSWLEFVPGEYGARKRDCELVARATLDEDFGFVALPVSLLERLWHLAAVAGDDSADAIADVVELELRRIKTQSWRDERDAC